MSFPIAGPRSEKAHVLAGVALAVIGAIAFSGKAIIVKLGYRYGTDAITLIALRMIFALPFFAATAWWLHRKTDTPVLAPGDRWKIVVLGFLGYYLASFLDFAGLQYISATLERLILYLNPTIVLLIGLLFMNRPVSARQWTALAISYVGVMLALARDFSVGGSNILLGGGLVMGSALAYALYLIGSGELVKRVGSIRLTAYASCIACFFCILQFALTRPMTSLVLPIEVYELSIVNGFFCTVLPVFAVMMAVSRIGAASAAQLGMVGPVSTIVLSRFILGELMAPAQIAGTVLVMIGVFIVSQR